MKLVKTLVCFAMMSGFAKAATITVSSGLPAQGITPTLSGAALSSFSVAVGTWNGVEFTQFGNVLTDTAKVNGQFTATGPSSFNSGLIAVFVGTGASTAASVDGTWAIFTATAGTSFPSDVSQATGVTFAMTLPTVLNVVAKGSEQSGFVGNNFNFVPVPEPSTALLGLLGVAGLIRRRR